MAGLAGVGAVPAWLISSFSRRMVTGLVTVALLVGLAGGWAGFLIGTPPVRDELVDLQSGRRIEFESPVRELFTKSGIQMAWVGGAVIFASSVYISRREAVVAAGAGKQPPTPPAPIDPA